MQDQLSMILTFSSLKRTLTLIFSLPCPAAQYQIKIAAAVSVKRVPQIATW
jgi:hypothetical protein